jgi:hypothetical protein
MDMIAVESSTLATIGYDDAVGILQLEFRSRAIYQYFGVPAAVHHGILNAPSKGSYFNQFIRGRFPYRSTLSTEAVRRTGAPRSEGAR